MGAEAIFKTVLTAVDKTAEAYNSAAKTAQKYQRNTEASHDAVSASAKKSAMAMLAVGAAAVAVGVVAVKAFMDTAEAQAKAGDVGAQRMLAAIEEVERAVMAVKGTIVSALTPVVTVIARDVTKFINDHKDTIKQWADTLQGKFITAIKWALQGLHFFYNAWLGIKLVGNAALLFLAKGFDVLAKALELFLTPINVFIDALVDFGVIGVNPLAKGMEILKQNTGAFVDSQRELVAGTLVAMETEKRAHEERMKWADSLTAKAEKEKKATKAATAAAKEFAEFMFRHNLLAPHESYDENDAPSGANKEADKIRDEMAKRAKENAAIVKQAMAEAAWQGADIQLNELQQTRAFYDEKIRLLQEHNAFAYQIREVNTMKEEALRQRQFEMEQRVRDQQYQLALSFADNMGNLMTDLYSAGWLKGTVYFKLFKALQLAGAVIEMIRGVHAAWTWGMVVGGPPAAAVLSAIAAATGAARVAMIARTNIGATSASGVGAGGGGDGGYGKLPGTAAGADQPSIAKGPQWMTDKRPVINITVQGNIIDQDKFARELLPSINNAVRDGVMSGSGVALGTS